MGTFSSWFIRDAIELQNKICVFRRSIFRCCAVGHNIEQISSDEREVLESDGFHWEV